MPELPLYEKVTLSDLDQIIKKLADKKDLMVLRSAMMMQEHGEYSFICFDAFATFSSKNKEHYWNNIQVDITQPFDFIHEKINEYTLKKNENLPPLQGGVVGYFGYEASQYLEDLPIVTDNINLPDIYLNFYSTIIAFDHQLNQSWIIATGFPEKNHVDRVMSAQKSIMQMKRMLAELDEESLHVADVVLSTESITSNFSSSSYVNAVVRTKQYILNGDIFEANISQQFSVNMQDGLHPHDLYLKLMTLNPSPYSAFINIHDQGYIIAASPERFVKLENQKVTTYPIKGTRPRSQNCDEDQELAEELLRSAKDHAENIMIVDLMRNDLSKVCELGSIQVDELCALKSFATLHHLVSKIRGILKDKMTAMDLLQATFPPGSVTGAPKIRAMEIISALEMKTRGPYCGCMGYISFTGDMDTSVIIRSYFIHGQKIFFSTGGAVVLDSDPEAEYRESMVKAASLMKALTR